MLVGRPFTAKWPWPTKLAGLGPRAREAHPVHDVVESQLERAEQVLAGHAGWFSASTK